MSVFAKKYQNHSVFKLINEISENYNFFSYSSFNHLNLHLSLTTNIDSIIFSSLKGTLNSINDILKVGRINDAFSLLRKYYEGVIIDIYKSAYIKEKYTNLSFDYAEQIEKWCKGEKELPQYSKMIKYLQRVKCLEKIRPFYDIQEKGFYDKIKMKCNENLHYNKLGYMLLNNSDYYVENREQYLTLIHKYISAIFEFHMACLFILHPEYWIASDYIDALECGCTPKENSQYWISPAGQQMFNKLWGNKPQIAELLKKESNIIFEEEINL